MPLWKKTIAVVYEIGSIIGWILVIVEVEKIIDGIFNLRGMSSSILCFALGILAIFGKGIKDGAL